MKIKLKDIVDIEADVEGIVKTGFGNHSTKPQRKTRYQIRQEEKRKNKELEHKQQMQRMFILLALIVLFLIVGLIARS